MNVISSPSNENIALSDPSEEQRRAYATARIVGGSLASIGEYPFYARIDVYNRFFCGASLIAPRVVLTAAHCVSNEDVPLYGYRVTVGAYTHESSEYQFGVVRKLIHPEYTNYKSDFALLFLDGVVPEDIPWVELNSDIEEPAVFEELTVIGMGLTSDKGKRPKALMEVNVKSMEYSTCRKSYGRQLNWASMLCAFGDNNEDSCKGDSGGPLLIAGTNLQVGVVSWGVGCGENPGVYARVSNALEWIQENVCDLSEPQHSPEYCPNYNEGLDLTVDDCADDPLGFYTGTLWGHQFCDFISTMWYFRYYYCTEGTASAEACPLTCGLCTPKEEPSMTPSSEPTTHMPTTQTPSETPTATPTATPTSTPSTSIPTTPVPSERPSKDPSSAPTTAPSDAPMSTPVMLPTAAPSQQPNEEEEVSSGDLINEPFQNEPSMSTIASDPTESTQSKQSELSTIGGPRIDFPVASPPTTEVAPTSSRLGLWKGIFRPNRRGTQP